MKCNKGRVDRNVHNIRTSENLVPMFATHRAKEFYDKEETKIGQDLKHIKPPFVINVIRKRKRKAILKDSAIS